MESLMNPNAVHRNSVILLDHQDAQHEEQNSIHASGQRDEEQPLIPQAPLGQQAVDQNQNNMQMGD